MVTGKLDVREAARLPDEAEEREPFDQADVQIDADEEPGDELLTEPAEADTK